MNRSGTRLTSPMTTMHNKKAHEMTYPRPKYSPSKEIEEAKNKAVPNSANIIHMCLFSVLARRGRGMGKEGPGSWWELPSCDF